MRPPVPRASRSARALAERFTDSNGREYIRCANGQTVRGDRAHLAAPARALTNGRLILRFPSVPYVSGRQRRKLAKAERMRASRERAAKLEQREVA